MFAYFHFFVESSFFRKVANHGNVRWLKSFAIQEYFAFIRSCDLINDPDQGGLACAVGPKQSENTAFLHLQAYMIKGYVVRIFFQDKIGRESCRERVCQEVSISGFCVSIK